MRADTLGGRELGGDAPTARDGEGLQSERIPRIGRQALRLRQPHLRAHDVRAQHHRDHLVLRMAAAHAFASHPAIGGNHDPLGRGVLQRLANDVGYLVRPLDLQRVVVDDADHNLLVSHDPADRFEIAGARGADFEGQRVGIDLVQRLQSRLVALHVAEDALLRRVAPAGVAPHLGLAAQPFAATPAEIPVPRLRRRQLKRRHSNRFRPSRPASAGPRVFSRRRTGAPGAIGVGAGSRSSRRRSRSRRVRCSVKNGLGPVRRVFRACLWSGFPKSSEITSVGSGTS
jgi:hypothetical protein